MCCLDYNKYVAKWSCNISCWQELLQVKKTIKVLQRATLYYNIFGSKILFWSKRLHFKAKIDNFLTYMLFNVLVLQKINFYMYTNSLVNGDLFYTNFTNTTSHSSLSTYKGFSPYANFITANFITAIFQNFPKILGLCTMKQKFLH